VVDKVAVVQVFSEYLGFPCQVSFHRLLRTHHLSSGAGTIGQLVAAVPSGLSLTKKLKKKFSSLSVSKPWPSLEDSERFVPPGFHLFKYRNKNLFTE
jgi:hypothetical protein